MISGRRLCKRLVHAIHCEHDAETLAAYGFVATTSAFGAKAEWLPHYTEALGGKEIIIIPVNDAAGWGRAQRIAEELFSVVAALRLLPLPKPAKDVTDWSDLGHREVELIAMRHAPAWEGVISFNESKMAAVATKKPPFKKNQTAPFNWADVDDVLTAAWLQGEGIFVNREIAGQAVQVVVSEHTFHPVRDYLNSPTWDSTPGSINGFYSKNSAMQIRGVWIVESSELDALAKSEMARIKAFMSRQVDHFRPPYGKHVINVKRECISRTTNKENYLRDETGGRRFWPVKCGAVIRIDDLKRDRDQLWAETRHHLKAGEIWWLDTPELFASAAMEVADRYEGTLGTKRFRDSSRGTRVSASPKFSNTV